MADIVQFEHVAFRHGTGSGVLAEVSFSPHAGTFYFLTGPGYAGKTSLLRLSYLAQRPSRSIVRIFNENTRKMPRGRIYEFRGRLTGGFFILAAAVARGNILQTSRQKL